MLPLSDNERHATTFHSTAIEGHRLVASGARRRTLDETISKVCMTALENTQGLPDCFGPLHDKLLSAKQSFERLHQLASVEPVGRRQHP